MNSTRLKKTKFDLPPINLLKIPSNKDKNKLNEDDFIDSEFFRKNSFRFWC